MKRSRSFENQPADCEHSQGDRRSFVSVYLVEVTGIKHSLPDDGSLPGSACLHVISRPETKEDLEVYTHTKKKIVHGEFPPLLIGMQFIR